MPLPAALESLMRATPPMGRTAPSADALGAAAAAGGASPGTGGPSPAPPSPAAAGGGANPFASIVSSRISDASGVDPTFILDQLQQMKIVVSKILQHSVLRYPGQVDKEIQRLLGSIDSTVKAFQQAQQHQAALQGAGAGAGAGTTASAGPSPIDFAGANVSQSPGMPAMV